MVRSTSDLRVTVDSPKLRCVLDPALVLGHSRGPALALRLTQVLEPWLTRSFWQMIDASELLRRSLERQEPGSAQEAGLPQMPDSEALRIWLALRDSTDAGSWPLRWVGDNLPESQLKDAADSDIVERFEALTGALAERAQVCDLQVPAWSYGLHPVLGALDALALSACLDGALVLSLLPGRAHELPWPVQTLARAGLRPQQLEPMPPHTLFATEREFLREALVCAGLAALSERLPPLAAVHVLVEDEGHAAGDPWDGARAWWYAI